jgi:hypothetical protein
MARYCTLGFGLASLMPDFLLVICGLAGLTYLGKQIGRLFHGWKRIL